MSNILRQSTAAQSRALGPFVDDTDFKTAATGLTIANTDIKLIIDGGASANKNSGGGTHRINGMYGVTFDATDTATVGEMEVSVKVAGALQVFKTFRVVEEAVYDALFAAAALGYVANAPVNVAQFGGSNLTSAAGVPEVKVSSIAANAITATSIAADAITDAKVASDVTIASVTGAVGSVTGNVGGNVTGSVGSIATGGIAAASFAAGAIDAAAIATDAIDADALKADAVTEIQSGLSTLNAAGVRAAVGLASANLDTQIATLATSSALSTVGGNVSSIKTVSDLLQVMIEVGSGSPTYYRFTAGAVELAPTGGSAPSAATVASAVRTELTTELARVDVAISTRASQTSADDIPTNAELTTALGTADDAVLAAVAALTIPTTAQIADKLLGRNLAGGSDGGRMVKDALRSLRNKSSITAGTLTVCEEDDTTTAWTAAVSTTPGDPLSSIDPA